ncbi:phosphopyruvate hydratase [Lactiplantibacillus paraplantarum]|uniref:Enolase n=1 Tax=Lactiplantibacillus paraplantarum TaxID=60520 RepID=A0AAD0TNX2_9LACO|nr:phosphopyruvate hydratase [Lactiplantibacillus paraplantarum]AVW10109.1 phosphopyruvate hydratase [Lactiplantibacillus paraplantarum]AYJ38358.1 phosphopyruvate hydratase [Lactiplantibacillus paraplantarum]ERL44254.1 enolase [Lactiplantibacillus paraplantarum]KRL46287.1 enolase [Lactiplantibacillus paraplantarum DSM 10667]MCU4683427.1 phosphopyruvate hydratase [Lactiplantibacillus paraplantarum]
MSVVIDVVKAREVFDSRGNPTVEADVILSDGTLGRAEVPSGASTGANEAVELRDGGQRLQGKGTTKAVNNVNTEINDALHGVSPFNQAQVDQIMIDLDGTPNKERLGANAILGVSMATCRAAAAETHQPLYRYLGGTDLELPQTFHNVINGGEHADNGIDIQEFMITAVDRSSFRDGFEKIVNTYHTLKKVIEKAGYTTGLGDEGGFAPDLDNSEAALQMLHNAIVQAGYVPGKEIAIAFDAAASYFYNTQTKQYDFEGQHLSPDALSDYYAKLLAQFPEIISIEDPYSEDDWENFVKFTKKYGDQVQIVTDDNVCTNPTLFAKAIKMGMANAFLIKLNQIGTVTETLTAIRLARKNGYATMMSHRSGETGDTFLADFTVATRTAQLKSGAPARSERVEKYNQLLRIEEELGTTGTRLAHFPDSVDYDL